MTKVTPELLLHAYTRGVFPMARDAHATELFWFDPEQRGIIPLESFHVPRSLSKALRRTPFTVTFDQAFEQVITACADREETWINGQIVALYTALHRMGFAHSVEVWRGDPRSGHPRESGDPEATPCSLPVQGSRLRGNDDCRKILVGGLYGVALGAAFFGESMFSRESNASKAALVALVTHLRARGYLLFDTQFINDHLLQFGAVEISREAFRAKLAEALTRPLTFG